MESTVINTHEKLNGVACQMLLNSSECDIVYMTTKSCRWLSVRVKDEYISVQQKKLIERLNEIKQSYKTDQLTSLNARILVYEKPTKKENESILSFIRAGADVRYIKSNNTQRMILIKNRLYLSHPILDNKYSVVGKGILLEDIDNNENPLFDYYRSDFMSSFNKAKKLKEREGKIKFEKSIFARSYYAINDIEFKDVILLIGGAILGGIISIILT